MNAEFVTEKMVKRVARELCKAVRNNPDEIVFLNVQRWQECTEVARAALDELLFAPQYRGE